MKKVNYITIVAIIIANVLLPTLPDILFGFFIFVIALLNIKCKIRKKVDIYWFAILIVLFLTLVRSVFLGDINVNATSGAGTVVIPVLKQNIRYLSYIIFSLLSFRLIISFRHSSSFINIRSVCINVLFIFLILFYLFYFIEKINPNLFYNIKNFYFGVNVDMRANVALQNSGYLSRYSFLFLDPNNCSYCIIMICIFLYDYVHYKGLKVFLIFTMIFTVFATQSRGALLAILCYLFIKIIMFIRIKEYRIDPKTIKKLIFVICLTIIILLVGGLIFTTLVNFNVFKENGFIYRLFNAEDSRMSIWLNLIKILKFPPIIGNGYTLFSATINIKPHSDLLRFLYSYGILFVILLVCYFTPIIKKSSNILFLIPCLIAILINSVLDEPRFLFIIFILIAINYLNRRNNKETISKSL